VNEPAPTSRPPDDAFGDLVAAAVDRLPAEFRARLGSVAIVVEDEPTPDQLAATGAQGLFGLYQGVPRTAFGADGAAVASKITIFRGPLMRASQSAADLARKVDDVVLHEIAHHFGIGDARLRELRPGR
jgi:predicted Zn-dependent protease with MMP-like domain